MQIALNVLIDLIERYRLYRVRSRIEKENGLRAALKDSLVC